jgi:hypothetical protein
LPNCLALPCLALPCLALPCLALPCLALVTIFYHSLQYCHHIPYCIYNLT